MLDKIPVSVISDQEKIQLRKDYLRPRYPIEWLKDEDQGLSQTMSTLDKDLSWAENFAGKASKLDIGTPEAA